MTDSSNVIRLVPDGVGDGYRIEADTVLKAAKGREYHRLVVIGQDEEGELYLAGTANAGESLILIELAKHQIVHGE